MRKGKIANTSKYVHNEIRGTINETDKETQIIIYLQVNI